MMYNFQAIPLIAFEVLIYSVFPPDRNSSSHQLQVHLANTGRPSKLVRDEILTMESE